MATIVREVTIEAPASLVWDAVRDVGVPHRRLVPRMLRDTRLEDGARVVTFSDGFAVRETIVTIDDAARRFAYAASGGRTAHHNASMQVFDDGPDHARLVWITDLLPDAVAGTVAALMDAGAADMQRTLAQRR